MWIWITLGVVGYVIIGIVVGSFIAAVSAVEKKHDTLSSFDLENGMFAGVIWPVAGLWLVFLVSANRAHGFVKRNA